MIFLMLDTEVLIEKIISLKHEESPAVQSPEFQAFINGWNNSLEEVIKHLKDENLTAIHTN